MLTIRLQRTGRKNQPFFKIVVTEKIKSSTRGRFVEELGFYNPLTKEKSLKGDRAKYWMSTGAQPSDTVYNMLVTEKVVEGAKIPKHKKSKKEQPAAEATPAPAVQEQPAEEPAQTAEPTEAPKEASEEQPKEQPAAESQEKPAS